MLQDEQRFPCVSPVSSQVGATAGMISTVWSSRAVMFSMYVSPQREQVYVVPPRLVQVASEVTEV